MKLSPASVALCALCALAPAAFGQLVTSVDVVGVNTGVTSHFKFTINPTTNTLIIDVDNTVLGADGVHGTITSFGFNTPFTDKQLGNNGSNVSFTQVWTDANWGHYNLTKWNKFEPYNISQNGGYHEELGVGTGNTPTGGTTSNGIKFGEQVRFTFTFPDFTPQQVAGFYDGAQDIVVRWQEVNDTRFQSYCDTNRSDYGWGDIPPTPEPSTYGLMGAAALLGIVGFRRHAQKKRAAAVMKAA